MSRRKNFDPHVIVLDAFLFIISATGKGIEERGRRGGIKGEG